MAATSHKKKILVVEDEKPMARALVLKLTNSGFEAFETHDGNEALEALKKGKYDLILMDLMMPNMDGFQVLNALKAKKITTPVVVSSNLGQEEDIQKAKSLGAKDFIIKSNTPLVDIINRIKKLI